MIKASALKPIGCERPVLTTDSQNFNKQNMIIESISGEIVGNTDDPFFK